MKKYLKVNRMYMVLLILVILLGTSFAVGVQFLKGEVLNLALSGDSKALLYTCLALLIGIMLEIAFMYGQSLLENKLDFLCTKGLKEDLFQATLHMDYIDFKSKPSGEYINKFTTELATLRQSYLSSIFLLIMFIVKILFVTVALVWLNVYLALITLFLLTMPLYIPKLAEKLLIRNQNRYLKDIESFLGTLNNYLECFEIIKNYNVENNIINQFKRTNTKVMTSALKNNNTSALVQIISTFMSYFSYFVVVIFSGYLVVQGEFNAGEFFIAINMIDQLSYPLIALSGCIQGILSVKEVNANITAYCYTSPTVSNRTSSKQPTFKNCLSFNQVSFSYGENHPILKDLSLVFQKGKKYLIKGKSGAGKTTLINLLLDYYKPTQGSIYIDHLLPVATDTIYDLVTVVRQDNLILSDTLRNNLTLYNTISDERLIDVLKQVQLEQFATPEYLNMTIGNSGNNLSGGERKRLCIARALLFQKDILILDEPLANLDPGTMLQLEKEILSLKDVTLIFISHVISPKGETYFDEVITLG